jgi:hypothetical protein
MGWLPSLTRMQGQQLQSAYRGRQFGACRMQGHAACMPAAHAGANMPCAAKAQLSLNSIRLIERILRYRHMLIVQETWAQRSAGTL